MPTVQDLEYLRRAHERGHNGTVFFITEANMARRKDGERGSYWPYNGAIVNLLEADLIYRNIPAAKMSWGKDTKLEAYFLTERGVRALAATSEGFKVGRRVWRQT